MSSPQESRAGSSTTEASQAESRLAFDKLAIHARDSLSDFIAVEGQKTIGSGSFGRVKKVAHKRTQEIYAMKTMAKDKIEQMSMTPYVLREVKIQQRVQHPHILRLFQFFEDGDNVHLLLEYASGGSLYQVMKRQGRLSELEAGPIFAGIASALDHLHGQLIIHRDVKPENILMCTGGTAKLADFGWCADIENATENRGTFCGTLDYLAPEMIHGEPHNFTVDNWAMGILLFEMLVGEAPWGKSQWEITQRIGSVDLKVPDTVPAAACDLIRKLLVRRPDDRLALAEALRHAWVRAHAPNFEPDGVVVTQPKAGSSLGENSPSLQFSLAPCNSLPFGLKPEGPVAAPSAGGLMPLESPLSPSLPKASSCADVDVRLGLAAAGATPLTTSGRTPLGSREGSSQRGPSGGTPGAAALSLDTTTGGSMTNGERCGSLLHRIDLDESVEGDAWVRRKIGREESGSMSPIKASPGSGLARSPQGSVASSCANSCASWSSTDPAGGSDAVGRAPRKQSWKETNTYSAVCDFVRRGAGATAVSSGRRKCIENVEGANAGSAKSVATPQRVVAETAAGAGRPGSGGLATSAGLGFTPNPRTAMDGLSIKVPPRLAASGNSRDPDDCDISPLACKKFPFGQDNFSSPPVSAGCLSQPPQPIEEVVAAAQLGTPNGNRASTRLSGLNGLGDKMGTVRAKIADDLDDLNRTLAGRLGTY